MKKLALGIVTAALLATAAAPAIAQAGFYAAPGGVGVDFGAPGPYYYNGCGHYGCGGYYDYYGGPNVAIGGGWNNGWRGGWHGGHPHVHVHR